MSASTYDHYVWAQDLFLRQLVSLPIEGVTGLFEELLNGDSIRTLLLQCTAKRSEGHLSEPLLVCVTEAWYSPDTAIFCFLDSFKDKAEDFVLHSLLLCLQKKFPDVAQEVAPHFSNNIQKVTLTLTWDPSMESARTSQEEVFGIISLGDHAPPNMFPPRRRNKAKNSSNTSKRSKKSHRSKRSQSPHRSKTVQINDNASEVSAMSLATAKSIASGDVTASSSQVGQLTSVLSMVGALLKQNNELLMKSSPASNAAAGQAP